MRTGSSLTGSLRTHSPSNQARRGCHSRFTTVTRIAHFTLRMTVVSMSHLAKHAWRLRLLTKFLFKTGLSFAIYHCDPYRPPHFTHDSGKSQNAY